MHDPASLTDALSQHATPIETTDPDADRTDLEPIMNAIGEASIIGLGEATHGTREFFQLKDRLIRYLVAVEGVRLVAMEASFAESMAIDRYITEGNGNVLDALENIQFWTWDTREVVAMLEWLRDFNDERPRDDQVRFWGFGCHYTADAATTLRATIETVDPDHTSRFADTYETLESNGFRDEDGYVTDALDAGQALVDAVYDALHHQQDALRDTLGDREYELRRQLARALEQAVEFHHLMHEHDSFTEAGRYGDRVMAENVNWILDQSPHHRIALWAHNEHIRRGELVSDDWGPYRTMGDHLAEMHESDYTPIGFDFTRGSIRGIVQTDHGQEIGTGTFGDPDEDSLTATLSHVDHPHYFLDVQGAAANPPLDDLLTSEQRIRTVGSMIGDEADHWTPCVPADGYDGLLFVQESTPAQPNERSS